MRHLPDGQKFQMPFTPNCEMPANARHNETPSQEMPVKCRSNARHPASQMPVTPYRGPAAFGLLAGISNRGAYTAVEEDRNDHA